MTWITHVLLLAAILLLSSSATAGCTYIAELYSDTLYLDISDGGCGELSISFSTKIGKDGRPASDSVKQFPFSEKCGLNVSQDGKPVGLSCHAKGHTPLAGATYKRRKAGITITNCGYEGEKDEKVTDFEYVCTKGCNKPSVPKVLSERHICD